MKTRSESPHRALLETTSLTPPLFFRYSSFLFFFPLGSNSYSLYYRWVFDENVVTIRYEMFSNCGSLVILLWWSLIDFCNGSVSLADWFLRMIGVLDFSYHLLTHFGCYISVLFWTVFVDCCDNTLLKLRCSFFFLNVLKGLSNSASFLEWMRDIVLGNWPFKSVSLWMYVNCLPFV